MPYNGSGTFSRIYNWQNDDANGIPILSSRMDEDTTDIANALSNVITRDGQGGPTADISFNNHKLINLKNGTNPQDAITLSQANGSFAPISSNGPVTPEQFGAVGDGVTDDYAAFQACITAAQNGVYGYISLAAKNYKINQTLVITKPLTIIGARPQGIDYPGLSPGAGIAAIIGSNIVWGGANTDPVIFIQKVNAGGTIKNLTVNGGNSCSYCIHADTIIYWNFENIWCRDARVFGFYLDSRLGSCSWNTFRQLRCSAGYGFDSTAGLALAGYEGFYNTCHNTFINTTLEHGRTAYGLLLGFCDNNTFIDTYILTDNTLISPTAYGVTYTPSGSVWAYGNTFLHLQAGNKGYYEPPGSYGGNQSIATIIGYATDNAQPLPVRATATQSGNTYAGTYISFLSGDVWSVRTTGVNTPDSARLYPYEILSPNPNSNGTQLKLGQSHFIGSNLMQTFDLTGCHINAAGTVIADNGTAGSGSGSGLNFNGSSINGYCFSGLTVNTAVTVSAASQAFGFTNSAGAWTYGFCGVTPSVRDAGYGTPTNTAKIVSFNAATVTLPQTAGILGALIIELKNKGLIGA